MGGRCWMASSGSFDDYNLTLQKITLELVGPLVLALIVPMGYTLYMTTFKKENKYMATIERLGKPGRDRPSTNCRRTHPWGPIPVPDRLKTCDRFSSPFIRLLNGTWKFQLVPGPLQRVPARFLPGRFRRVGLGGYCRSGQLAAAGF